MALTAVERRVLIAAREAIRARQFTFVCYAITGVKVKGRTTDISRAKRRLASYVRFSLGGSATLDVWLSKRNGGRFMDETLRRHARVAWITWMLDEPINLTRSLQKELEGFSKKLYVRTPFDEVRW